MCMLCIHQLVITSNNTYNRCIERSKEIIIKKARKKK